MGKLKLFEAVGVELEYMIVDSETLKVKPIADELIKTQTGDYTSDVERGEIAWSNELVSHVIELKTNGPAKNTRSLARIFHEEVVFINDLLKPFGAKLLPTGAHPFFDPAEAVIWPHEYNEVYALYDKIFGCKGHGWSNLQSTHINLPFDGDEEFAKLHAAIRLLLPIIPALAASTPVIDGRISGLIDTRLEFYRKNQQKIPVIAGMIIPEEVYTQSDYESEIFAPIIEAISVYDTDRVLEKYFLNSRGAIARFDRGAIEIRLIDIQECPLADVAIVDLITASLKWLIHEHEQHPALYRPCPLEELHEVFVKCIHNGSAALVENTGYLELFGLKHPAQAFEIWASLFEKTFDGLTDQSASAIRIMLAHGNLSERILKKLPRNPQRQDVELIYHRLSECLNSNCMFL
ncbi:MAG: glutamate-cysteine ligase family protein [Salibacteraceae bacterium]